MPQDTAPPASKEEIIYIQQVVVSIFYYARAVELTVLVAPFTNASDQAKATKSTQKMYIKCWIIFSQAPMQ